MQESDTYLMILEEGQAKGQAKGQEQATRESILCAGRKRAQVELKQLYKKLFGS